MNDLQVLYSLNSRELSQFSLAAGKFSRDEMIAWLCAEIDTMIVENGLQNLLKHVRFTICDDWEDVIECITLGDAHGLLNMRVSTRLLVFDLLSVFSAFADACEILKKQESSISLSLR